MSEPITLEACLEEINHALNYWYPLRNAPHVATDKEREARHVRLFQFRERLQQQLKKKPATDIAGDGRCGG